MFEDLKLHLEEVEQAVIADSHLFTGAVEVIAPSVSIENEDIINWEKVLPCLERIMRTCYKSEGVIKPGSDKILVNKLVHVTHHESTIEHAAVVSFRMIIDRGISHEVVRHRIASYSQESTRYVNYSKKGGGQVIYPYHLINKSDTEKLFWYDGVCAAFKNYHDALHFGWTPQEARTFLPHAAKTELIATFNFRSLRNFFNLRMSKAAHPDIKLIAEYAAALTKEKIDVIFDDINITN